MRNKIILALLTFIFLAGWGTSAEAVIAPWTYTYYKVNSAGVKSIVSELGVTGSPIFRVGDTISIEPNVVFPSSTFIQRLMGSPIPQDYNKTDYLIQASSTVPSGSDNPPLGVTFNSQTGIFSGTIKNPTKPLTSQGGSYAYDIAVFESGGWISFNRTSLSVGFELRRALSASCALTTLGMNAISAPYPDPDYVATTLATRNFTPKIPVNPFDDMIVDIDLNACPDAYKAWITTTDTSGQPVTIQDSRLFSIANADPTTGIYKWKLLGWPMGITYPDTSYKKVEILVDSIVKHRPINVEVKKFLNINTYSAILTKKSFTMSKCARIYGGGGKPVVYLLGQAVTRPVGSTAADLVTSVGKFNSTAPFSAINPDTNTPYKYKFRHILDLQKYDDSQWQYTNYLANFNKPLLQVTADMFGCSINMQTINNDPGSGIFMGITSFDPKYGAGGVAHGNYILIDEIFLTDKTVFIHELGHVIGGLKDEYIPKSQVGVVADPKLWTPMKNCSSNPYSSFRYQGSNYAPGQEIGCFFERISSLGGAIDVFRPTIGSIMGSGSAGVDKFNVVSCGWILKNLKSLYGKNASAHSLFPECNLMPGIAK